MDLGLKNKVALVCGASKGIGKSCAVQLAKEKTEVIICSRNLSSLKKTADEIREMTNSSVLYIPTDLSIKKDVDNLISKILNKFNKIDILITNSGGPLVGNFFDFTDKDWKDTFNKQLLYIIRLYQKIIPMMQKNNWGRIINITSLAIKEPDYNLVLSSVFRSGVASLAKALSRELIKNNITINNICPGAFKTERVVEIITKNAERMGMNFNETEMKYMGNLPANRYQDLNNLGDLVAFLASENSENITGTTIQIDDGMSKGLF